MALRQRPRPRLCSTLALVGAALLAPMGEPAWATSKATVAAIGGAAPGGGVFAGPGFSGWPTAAGNGWIAFRGQVTGGTSTEAVVVAHMTPPLSRTAVASIGQAAPSANGHSACAGKIRQFVGHPVVTVYGEVAFVALLEPPAPASKSANASTGPTPAGLFVLRGGQLDAVACSGELVGGRALDLTAVLDLFSNPNADISDRSPAMNDAGDIAFLSGYVDGQGFPAGGAILVAPRAGGTTQLVRINDPFADGKLQTLGPPAINNHGMLAFHALATTTAPSDDGMLDGIFAVDAAGTNLRVLVRDGIAPAPAGQTLTEFQDAVALNDEGDVAFLAGPLLDASADANPSDEGGPGVLALQGGVVSLLGYPGQALGPDKVASVALGPVGGGEVAAPSLGPDGTVAFFVSLNGGNAEAIVHSAGSQVLPLVYTGGNGADASPVGGLYAGAESPPALDAAGGIVFLARIVGGQSSEAIVYRAADGHTSPIVLGEAAPQASQGFFGGRPFSAPHLNDAGDVVFRAYMARGPSSVGIFRAQSALFDPEQGMPLQAVVRAGDASPAHGAPPFLDFPGEPSINQAGAVAFAAQLNVGRGIFVADSAGVHQVVLRGGRAPGDPGAIFGSLGANPQINDSGSVAFAGATSSRDPVTGSSIKRQGIFIADSSGIRALVYARDPSPAGPPFFQLREPLLTDAPRVVFRALLGDTQEVSSGLFTADATSTTTVGVALQPVGGGTVLASFSGTPSVTPSGDIAFPATLSKPISADNPALAPAGPAIFVRTASGGLGRVVARGMPGPAGGLFNNVSSPAMNIQGHVVFRGSFLPLSGGTSGLFLAADGGLSPYLLRSETSPLGGSFAAFGAALSFNAHDELAFSATLTGGNARSVIVMASPTVLTPRALMLHLTGGRGRDRIALGAALTLGRVSNGIHPAKEQAILSLSDTNGVLWTATVPKKHLAQHGRTFTVVPSARTDLGRALRSLKLTLRRNGTVRVQALSARVDLLQGGQRTLAPPFTLSFAVGDDSGTVAVPCRLGRRGGRCV